MTTFDLTAVSIGGDPAIGGDIEIILVLDQAPPCGALFIDGNYCAPPPVVSQVVSTSTIIGETYYFTISSTGAEGSYTVCVNNTSPPPSPGYDCTSSEPLCSVVGFTQGTFSGIGASENIATNSCFGQNERQSKWYTFTCTQSGTFELLIDPNVYSSSSQNGDDYDFALWDVTAGCYASGTTMGTPIACNWSGCTGSTGISSVAPYMTQIAATDYQVNNPPGPGTCDPGAGPPLQWVTTAVNLTACNSYALLIDNFTSSAGGFSTDFGGTAILGPQADFTYVISDNIPGDCRVVSVARPTGYCTSTAMEYFWNFGDGNTSNSASPASHTYLSDGLYTVSLQVTDVNGCVKTYSSTINVGCLTPLPIELLTFKAQADHNQVNVSWATAVEVDNDFFTIERSIDATNFEQIGSVSGAGFSSVRIDYTFTDISPQFGLSYYRLRQTDYNGFTETFDPVAVYLWQNMTAMTMHPGSSEGVFEFESHCRLPTKSVLQIHDILGHEVFRTSLNLNAGINHFTFDMTFLQPGLYNLRLQSEGEFDSISFVNF